MDRADAIVVGGGIAGLAAALELARRGVERVRLFEREPLLASHSSARNAAIWLPTEDDDTTAPLTLRSAALLDALVGREAWLTPTGALLTATDATLLGAAARGAARVGLAIEEIGMREATALCPPLEGGVARAALHLPEAGTLDVSVMTEALAREARARGVVLQPGVAVDRVRVDATGRVEGVALAGGDVVGTRLVVAAPGAWAQELARAHGAHVPVVPLRRHLVHLHVGARAGSAIVWHVGEELYFRPESGGILASPCDEDAHAPGLPPTDAQVLALLAERLPRLCPAFEGARVRRAWACLRSYAEDRELVAGPDARVAGLHWLAGLGGRGMTVGPAAGELVATLATGGDHPLSAVVAPARYAGPRP